MIASPFLQWEGWSDNIFGLTEEIEVKEVKEVRFGNFLSNIPTKSDRKVGKFKLKCWR